MELKELTPEKSVETKSVYVKINREKIENINKMISLLNKRKELIVSYGKKDSTPFDENEMQILLLKTDYELQKHHKNLIGIKKEVEDYIEKASIVVLEITDKWNEVVGKAKKEAVKKADIRTIVASMDDVDFEDNIDVKINYYLQLKSMVYNTGNPSKNSMKKV